MILRRGSDADDNAAKQVCPTSNETILRIEVTLQVILGTKTMTIAESLRLKQGTVITLDQRVGDPVTIAINGHAIALGQMVVLDEHNSRFGVTITELINAPKGDSVE